MRYEIVARRGSFYLVLGPPLRAESLVVPLRRSSLPRRLPSLALFVLLRSGGRAFRRAVLVPREAHTGKEVEETGTWE